MKSDLIRPGSRVSCGNSHKGILVNYFTGSHDYDDEDTLYGVIKLDNGYWTEGVESTRTYIEMLVVHVNNLAKDN